MYCETVRFKSFGLRIAKCHCLKLSDRYSGVCFHIFYCNSAGLSNVHYNGVFVLVGFLIAGCHCIIAVEKSFAVRICALAFGRTTHHSANLYLALAFPQRY